MTAKELSQLYWLNREIEADEKTLKMLESAATGTTSKITGLPNGVGISDKTAIAAEIADCKNIIEAKKTQCIAEYNRLHRYIATIDDSLTRQIVALRCINGLSWRQVAFHIGGGNTESGVKMIYYRYLKQDK